MLLRDMLLFFWSALLACLASTPRLVVITWGFEVLRKLASPSPHLIMPRTVKPASAPMEPADCWQTGSYFPAYCCRHLLGFHLNLFCDKAG